jgi:hypothetical protein
VSGASPPVQRSSFRHEHAQSRHAAELGPVQRRDAEAVRQCSGRDPEIVRSDRLAAARESCPDLGVDACNRLGDRDRLDPGEQMLDEGPPPRPPSTGRAKDAVQELAYGHHADRAVLVADKAVEPVPASFALDEEIRVDQDGQAPSAGPASARIDRSSSGKPSSTGGAEASSSLNRAAGRNLTLGGASTATVAPFRVISISSPAATRFRTAEKFRDISVALRRDTAVSISDKSDGSLASLRAGESGPRRQAHSCGAPPEPPTLRE